MSLFDNFIKRVAVINKEYMEERYNDYRDSKNLSDKDLEISKLNYNIKKNLRDVLEVLEYFKQFLTYSDNLNMYKNDAELEELQDKIDANPEEYQHITQTNPVYTPFNYGITPSISRGQFIPKTDMNMTTTNWKYVMDKPTLESEIKNYLGMLNKDITTIKSDIVSLQKYSNDSDVTYPVSQFGDFDSVRDDLDEILQNISKFKSQTEKGVSLVQDSENLIGKVLASDKLHDVIAKLITLSTFTKVKFPKSEKLIDVNDKEFFKKWLDDKGYNYDLETEIISNNSGRKLSNKSVDKLVKEFTQYVYNKNKPFSDSDTAQQSEIVKNYFTYEKPEIGSISVKEKTDVEEEINHLKERLLNNRETNKLSQTEIDDIQKRISELSGVLDTGHRPVDTEYIKKVQLNPYLNTKEEYEAFEKKVQEKGIPIDEDDSLLLDIYRVKNFLKEYSGYLNINSQSLFSIPALNEKFDNLVSSLNYWYKEINKEYPIEDRLVNVSDNDIREFLIKLGFDSNKKNVQKPESEPEARNLISNLIKFINELRNKINNIKDQIKDVFKDNTNKSDAKASENKYNYKLFIDYLKNGLINESYIESRALSNLFHGKIDEDILNKFKESASKVISILNGENVSDYNLGIKVGLLYILYNAVDKLYKATLDRRNQDNKTTSIFTKLKESVEKADVSYSELESVFENLESLYSTLENVLAPVDLAKEDFNKLFKDAPSISISDPYGNLTHSFDLVYINELIEELENISDKINEASEFVNSIITNMDKDKAERDPSLNIKEMETAVALLNINESIKNDCNTFGQYRSHLKTAIEKLTK